MARLIANGGSVAVSRPRSSSSTTGRCTTDAAACEPVATAAVTVEFSTWTPHWLGAVDGPVELIALSGFQGERLHLHA